MRSVLVELTRAVETRHPWTRGRADCVGELAPRRRPAGPRIVETLPRGLRLLPCVPCRHERWDGAARRIAIADAFDAMTTARPYRAALRSDDALAERGRCAGTQFDPVLTHVCLDVWGARREAAAR